MPVTVSDLLAGLERLSPPVATWLLTYAVHSTLLLGIVWLVCACGGLRSNALKDLLWKAAVIGGIVTATLSVASGASFMGRIDVPGPVVLSAAGGALPASGAGAPMVTDNRAPGDTGGITGANGLGSSLTGGESPGDLSGGEPAASTLPPQSPRPAAEPESLADFLQSAGSVLLSRWSEMLVALWLQATAVAAIRAVVRRRRLSCYLGKRRVVREGPLVEELAALCRSAGIKLPIRITCSPTLPGPVSLGRGEICLPERVATDLSREQQRCILAHEQAHLVRHDPLWLAALAVIEVPFFFQPLNRLAHRRMQEAAEYLCDDWTVRQTGSALDLARCLLEVATWVQGRRPYGVPGLAGSASTSPLLRRVHRLLDARVSIREERVRQSWVVAAILVPLAACSIAPAFSIRPPAAVPAPQPQLTGMAAGPSESSVHFIDLKSKGDVVFTPDRKGVLSVSPAGSFMIEQYDGVQNRRVEIAPLDDGSLTHWYYLNSRAQPYDAGAQAWLERAMSQFVLATGPGSSPFPDLSPLPPLPDVNRPAHDTYAASVMDYHAPAANSHIEARAQGDISFTDDLTGITGISNGGFLIIEVKQGEMTRKLQAMPAAGGKVVLSYLINGHPQPSEAARAWLAEILPDQVPALRCHINPLALPPRKAQ